MTPGRSRWFAAVGLILLVVAIAAALWFAFALCRAVGSGMGDRVNATPVVSPQGWMR